jgi:hypothetical protein
MSDAYRPLDDGGFVPNDMLADAEMVGPDGRQSKRSSVNDKERQTSCCCSPGWLSIIAYLTLWIGGLIIALSEKRSYYVVFHSCQSMLVSSIYCIVAAIFAPIDVLVIMPTGVSVAVLSLGEKERSEFFDLSTEVLFFFFFEKSLVFAVCNFAGCVVHLCMEEQGIRRLVSHYRTWS